MLLLAGTIVGSSMDMSGHSADGLGSSVESDLTRDSTADDLEDSFVFVAFGFSLKKSSSSIHQVDD